MERGGKVIYLILACYAALFLAVTVCGDLGQ